MISRKFVPYMIHRLSYSGISPRFCKVLQRSFGKAEMIQEKLGFSRHFKSGKIFCVNLTLSNLYLYSKNEV